MSEQGIVPLRSCAEQIQRIPLADIRESLVTLRTEYNEEALKELGNSLVEHGQIQTIVVQPSEDGYYDLIIGSRRLRAAKLNGQTDIAAFVIQKREPIQALFLALAENLHRSDLDPFEEAQAFLTLATQHGLNEKSIAEGIGKPASYVRNRLQLLSMPEEVATLISEKRLALGYLKILARLPDGRDQVQMAHSIIQNRLTDSEARAQVYRVLQESPRQEHNPHELTAVKLQARIDEFISFLGKVPKRMKIRELNAPEKQKVINALQSLGSEARLLMNAIQGISPRPKEWANNSSTRPSQQPRNHRQEWPTNAVERICSPQRPSDEELSDELGYSVSAIRSMRAKMSLNKREK